MAATPIALEITTSSEAMNGPPFQSAKVPTITMNGNPFPEPQYPPGIPSGFQLVVIDQTQDLTDPVSILVNEYQPLPDMNGEWETVYQYMYSNLITRMLAAGNPDYQLVFLVSYGMDQNAPPTNDALQMFLEMGAGPQVQDWVKTADPGSGGGDTWVSIPVSYILVGTAGAGYGQGHEAYEAYSGDSGSTTLNVTLENGD